LELGAVAAECHARGGRVPNQPRLGTSPVRAGYLVRAGCLVYCGWAPRSLELGAVAAECHARGGRVPNQPRPGTSPVGAGCLVRAGAPHPSGLGVTR
jgi:hypothetical protein